MAHFTLTTVPCLQQACEFDAVGEGIEMTCYKCGAKFQGYRAGSWDWQPKMCGECKTHELMLKINDSKSAPRGGG